jgi:hypothetical protein
VNIRLPLYDIFGYLLPGIIALLAVVLVIWSLYLPTASLSFMTLPKQVWLLLIILAYFAEHFVQALGNLLSDLVVHPEENVFGETADTSCKELLKEAHSTVRNDLGVTKVEPRWMYRICDLTVVHCGATSERDIYVYREGFYRGASVSFALLTFALVIRCFTGKASLLWNGSLVWVPGSLLWLLVAASGAGCALMVLRFHRFAHHRVRHALVSYLLIHKKSAEVKNAGN